MKPNVPYLGDVVLVQDGTTATFHLTPLDLPPVAPADESAKGCPTHHAHRWWLPPAHSTQFCRVNEESSKPAFAFAVLGAALIHEPRSQTMSWAQMATFSGLLSGHDAHLKGLMKIDQATKEVTCAYSEKVIPLLSDLLQMLHALSSLCQPLTWRPPSSPIVSQPQLGARQMVT